MAQKNTKIDDVKRPDRVTPSATSRPILVSGQSGAPSDPMMVQPGGDKPEGEAVQVMSHTARTITPPSEIVAEKVKEDEAKETVNAVAPTDPVTADTSPAVTESSPETQEEKPDEPKLSANAVIERSNKTEEAERDPDAALSAEETAAAEAKAKREAELEELIASGKYTVPIDAVQRRRSRMHTIVLGLLALLLAVALLDLVADVGIIDLPSSVPHTHLFSGH